MLDIDDIGQNTRKSSKKLASLVVKHTDRDILKDLRWRIDKEEMVSSQTARVRMDKLSCRIYINVALLDELNEAFHDWWKRPSKKRADRRLGSATIWEWNDRRLDQVSSLCLVYY